MIDCPENPFEPFSTDYKEEEASLYAPESSGEEVCTPVSPDAPDPARAAEHLSKREPDNVWPYFDSEGQLLFAVVRWNELDGRKTILPLAWIRRPDGSEEWCFRHHPSPRPIYNLPQIAGRRDAAVVVCEGEKTAEAAAVIFPDHVATTSPAGAYAASKADWLPLNGRQVVIAPDANDRPDKNGQRPGEVYAHEVARQAFLNGATDVEVIDTAALSRMLPNGSERDGPVGWDLADAADDGWTHDALRNLIDTQPHLRKKLVREEVLSSSGSVPIIHVEPGELPRIADEAEAALIRSGLPIFRRSGSLVRLVTETVPAARDRDTVVARFRPMCVHSMIDCMAQTATFLRFDKKQQEWVSRDPPQKAADILLVRDGIWKLRPVAGIITAPTLRPDGSLISQTGYDPVTRLYLALDPQLRLDPIPEKLTKNDALEALQVLRDLLSGFTFASEVDEAVGLSGLMTAMLRGAMSVAPLHAVRAYTPGTGKSFLVDVIAAITTGRPCPVITPGKCEEEMEKRLGALLRDGVPIVSLDNVNGELGGDLLCQVTERPIVRTRILGQSKAPEFECRSAVFATGNNLTLIDDMCRRTVLCTLDAAIERPERRYFGFDPLDRALTSRSLFITAVLTIVRAYLLAGAPPVCGPIGSYGEWSVRVRSPLVWLGLPDPVDSMETARAEDPTLIAIREMFALWREYFPLNAPMTATLIIEFAATRDPSGDRMYPEFWELLLRVAGQGSEPSSRSLGKWLTKIRGRVVDGYRLVVLPDAHHGNRFLLEQTTLGAG